MTLDDDIKSIIETTIENDLQTTRVPKTRVPKLKKLWKCDHAHDFLYGHRVGYYKGLAEGFVFERYRRQLDDEEDNEVFEIVDRYARALRKYFSHYKQSKPKKS